MCRSKFFYRSKSKPFYTRIRQCRSSESLYNQMLLNILKSVKYLGRQGLALRRNWNHYNKEKTDSNFNQLNWLNSYLPKHVFSCQQYTISPIKAHRIHTHKTPRPPTLCATHYAFSFFENSIKFQISFFFYSFKKLHK